VALGCTRGAEPWPSCILESRCMRTRSASGKKGWRFIIVGTTIKHPSTCLFISPSPLLEKKRNLHFQTLLLNVQNPIRFHNPWAMATFTTYDHPIDQIQIQIWQWPYQWLQREKLDPCASSAQRFNAIDDFLVFHRNSHPDVVRPFKVRMYHC
jgi:hypothetical protein